MAKSAPSATAIFFTVTQRRSRCSSVNEDRGRPASLRQRPQPLRHTGGESADGPFRAPCSALDLYYSLELHYRSARTGEFVSALAAIGSGVGQRRRHVHCPVRATASGSEFSGGGTFARTIAQA